MAKILIIDDEVEVGRFLDYLLSKKGFETHVGTSGKEFEALVSNHQFQLAMLDVKLPDTTGLVLLEKLKEKNPSCKSIIMTGYSTVKTAVEAIKLGANDYIEKPFDNIDILEQLIDELLAQTMTTEQNKMLELAKSSGLIFGDHYGMRQLVTMAYKIAKKNVNVLIEGETGTGKEVLAHFIHLASFRSGQPFIGVNCGALTEALLESELFGHEKGAFTGAIKEKRGIFEMASSGSLFLDEIAEASLSTQVKLLRVLETGEFMRVGDESVRKTNTRVVAASHANLMRAVEEKKFREDLLYRLDVVKLVIPPLRERKEDIPLIISHLLEKHQSSIRFSEEVMKQFKEYNWPGNIRELSNVIKRCIALAETESEFITSSYLPDKMRTPTIAATVEADMPVVDEPENDQDFEAYLLRWQKQMLSLWNKDKDIDLEDVLSKVKELESHIGKAFVTKMLRETIGDRRAAAERLHINMRKLRYLLNEK